MSYIGESFVAKFGRPDPRAPSGLVFTEMVSELLWNELHGEIGAGYFRDRFLYLFGEGLDALRPCLDAWSFLVPPDGRERMIVGRNAHGFFLVLENPNGLYPEVYVLDPIKLAYWTDHVFDFTRLVGFWLAGENLHEFLDSEIYEAWRAESGRYLAPNEILGIEVPTLLGGEPTARNFAVHDIVTYYQSTAARHAKAFEPLGRPVPAVRAPKGNGASGKKKKNRG